MRNVYVITLERFTEEGTELELLGVHQTLEGAKEHFRELVWNEKANYIYNQTGSTDTSVEAMEDADIQEETLENDCHICWHIWLNCSWHEVFIHIREEQLLA